MKIFCLLPLFFSISGIAQSAKLDPKSFNQRIQNDTIQLLDVRTANEFKQGHIEHSLQADWTNRPEFNDRVQYLDKDRPVYVYCLVGGRSASAADWMRNNGFKHVYELEGGINAWKREALQLQGQPDEPMMSNAQYKALIAANKKTLVKFGAEWCPPCVKMQPVINSLLRDSLQLKFHFISIDAGVQTELMKEMNIVPIPVFIVYKNGKEVWRKEGIVSEEELRTVLN